MFRERGKRERAFLLYRSEILAAVDRSVREVTIDRNFVTMRNSEMSVLRV